jgi:serine/threonine protein kinase
MALVTSKFDQALLVRQVSYGLRCRYLILDVLGQGTFGQVVKCQNMRTHDIVAVKVVKNKPAYFNQSMMEVAILQLVRPGWCSQNLIN